MKFLIALLILASSYAHGSTITRTSKKSVIVDFDPFEENFVVGDRLIAEEEGEKKALIEITKIKGRKFLGRILHGKPQIGMKLVRFDVVSEPKPSVASPNVETVTIRFQSTFVWRGIPYNRPYIAGSIDFVNTGVLAGLTLANSDVPSTSEVDFYLGYALNRLNWSLTPMIAHYAYPGASQWNSWDYSLNFTYRILTLDVSYIPKYFGVDSSDTHGRIGVLASVSERWKMLAQVGTSHFSDEVKVRHKNFIDYKFGLLYSTPDFSVEFAFSDTNRVGLNRETFEDQTAAVMISKRF